MIFSLNYFLFKKFQGNLIFLDFLFIITERSFSGDYSQDFLSSLQVTQTQVCHQRRNIAPEPELCHGQRQQRRRAQLRPQVCPGRLLRPQNLVPQPPG